MVKYLNSFDKKSGNICGLGVNRCDGKEYEFYLDGSSPHIWVDVHKSWIVNNEEAWDSKKSKKFEFFDECVTYISKLFKTDIRKIKPIGFDKEQMISYIKQGETNE